MKKRNDRVLAEGEATGHAHVAMSDDVEVFGKNLESMEREMVAPNGTDITHEEHGTITIPPGDYEITIQREIDPDSEEVRMVRD